MLTNYFTPEESRTQSDKKRLAHGHTPKGGRSSFKKKQLLLFSTTPSFSLPSIITEKYGFDLFGQCLWGKAQN